MQSDRFNTPPKEKYKSIVKNTKRYERQGADYMKEQVEMKRVKEILEKRYDYLMKVKNEKEKALKGTPEGKLKIVKSGGGVQYYCRNTSEIRIDKYIRKEDIEIAKALAQKDYDEKILKAADKELEVIHKYLLKYPDENVESVFEKLHVERCNLIEPIQLSNEEYIKRWEAVSYKGKDFREDATVFYTAKGERVRSKSEVIIADALMRMGIPYRYEYPLYLTGMGEIYPDFFVLNIQTRKEFYWEHFGKMDEPSYAEKTVRKISCYNQNNMYSGEKVIFTYETRGCPINQKQIETIMKRYLC